MHANRFGGVRQSPVSVSNLAIRHRGFEHGETGRRDLRVVQIQVFELGEFFQVLIPDITDVRINQRQKLEFWQRLQMYEAGGGDSRPISGPRGNLQAPKCQGVTTSFPRGNGGQAATRNRTCCTAYRSLGRRFAEFDDMH